MRTALYSILVFCLVIFVHEFGHFITAKLTGIRVNEFALGMGPRLIHYQGKETDFSLRLLPIGGYNKMEGEDEDSDDPRAFNNAPIGSRILVVVAGAVMNVLTCIVILFFIYLSLGAASRTVGSVLEGYPAMEQGILPGDTIVQIDGEKIRTWNDVTDAIRASDDELIMTVLRGNEQLEFTVPTVVGDEGYPIIGIQTEVKKSPGHALYLSLDNTSYWIKTTFRFFGGLFRGEGSINDFSGPVGIVSIISEESKLGFVYVANLAALISLNLAIMNLLPFPALDGGRLVMLLYTLITKRKIKEELEGKINFVGLCILMGFALIIVVKDVAALL